MIPVSVKRIGYTPSTEVPPSFPIPRIFVEIYPILMRTSPIGAYSNFVNFSGQLRIFDINSFCALLSISGQEYIYNFSNIPVFVHIHISPDEVLKVLLSPKETVRVGGNMVEFNPLFVSFASEETVRRLNNR